MKKNPFANNEIVFIDIHMQKLSKSRKKSNKFRKKRFIEKTSIESVRSGNIVIKKKS